MTSPPTVTVIGTTRWGITLAVLLARNGVGVTLWARTAAEATALNSDREHRLRVPGVAFPPSLVVSDELPESLRTTRLVIFAVPSQHMRENVRRAAPHLRPGTLVMSAAKGLELESLLRMSEVMREELPPGLRDACCVLSGPNIAREIAAGLPAASVVAADDPAVASDARNMVTTPRFRVYSTTDMAGVELGGTLKNIMALGAGMSDGMGYGTNAKAAFLTRGLAEITRLGVAAGANPLTFAGLTGLGDLVATSTSPYSRNRRLGEALTEGVPLSAASAASEGVAEGVTTTVAARDLARRLNVDMPITELTYRVLYGNLDPRKALSELMEREPKSELLGIG